MWFLVTVAILQFPILLLTNHPRGDSRDAKTKSTHSLIAISLGLLVCLVSVLGIYQTDQQKKRSDEQTKRDKDDATKQVAIATEREMAAEAREKQMQESLLGLGIGLGLNQQAAMLALCPPPISTTDGHEEGSKLTTYKVLHYGKVDLWFSYPVGRYVDAQIGDKPISTKQAIRLNPCLATVLHLPKPPVAQQPNAVQETPEQGTSEQDVSHSGSGDGVAGFFGMVTVFAFLYWLFKGKKKQ